MRSRLWNLSRGHLVLTLKFGSICMLFLVSILIVACGPTDANAGLGSPPVTLTVNLNQVFASPTPTLPPYSCAAWATQSSPAYSDSNSAVQVYAKYVQNVNGNPVGMSTAHAQATVYWPFGSSATYTVNTTSDGLAVFQVPLQQSAVGRETLVAVSFTSADGQHSCNVTGAQDAFFVAVAVSPTPTDTPDDGNGGGNGNGNGNGNNNGNAPPTDTPAANPSPVATNRGG